MDHADRGGAGTSEATERDHVIAAQLATEAGEMLVELRGGLAEAGELPRAIGRRGDAMSHDLLVQRLATLRPDDAVLSEEGRDGFDRLAARRVWIVDPLDGTREYGEVPRTDWAVHVALAVDGIAVAGAVALPARKLTLVSHPAPTLPPAWDGPPRLVVSRSRPATEATWIARRLGGELVPLGSAGAKAMAVVLGEAEIYAHSGGQYEWDSAAPVAVARAAGLHVSRLDGAPLIYNQPDPYLPDLLICRHELAAEAIAAARW